MKTYEIPTASGVKTVTANSKAEAMAQVSSPQSQVVNYSDMTTPAKPLTVPAQKYGNQYSGLLANIDTINEQALKNIQPFTNPQAITQGQQNSEGLFDRLSSLLTSRKGQQQLTAEQYQTEGVDTAKKELDDITNQINTKSLAYRRQIEEIQKNTRGQYGESVDQDVGVIQRQAASELADLAVIQQAKNQNYSTAREIADRKISAELEQDQNQLDALKFFYSENKDQLNREEDKQFELAINERERLLTQEKADKQTISEYGFEALKNGASVDDAKRILGAKSPEEALTLAGPYIGKIDRMNTLSLMADRNSSDSDEGSNVVSQVLDGFTKFSDLSSSEQVKVRSELYKMGFNSSTVPEWYKKYTEEQLGAPVSLDVVQKKWDEYRKSIDLSKKSSGSSGEIDFDNL